MTSIENVLRELNVTIANAHFEMEGARYVEAIYILGKSAPVAT